MNEKRRALNFRPDHRATIKATAEGTNADEAGHVGDSQRKKDRRTLMNFGTRRSGIVSSLVFWFLLTLAQTVIRPIATCADSGARIVEYAETDIVPIHARIRFSTLIVLPANEEILDATTGDKEFWIINGAHNLCYLHPAQQGIRSNLNLITSTGHVYSFLLTEISKEPETEPDLKIFVERKEESTINGTVGVP